MSTNAQVVLLTTYLYEYFLCYVSVSHSLSNLSLNNNIMIEKCCYDNSLDICHVYMSRVFLASFMITINCSNLVRLVVLVSLDPSVRLRCRLLCYKTSPEKFLALSLILVSVLLRNCSLTPSV